MLTARSRRMFAALASVLVLLLTLAACGGGVKDTAIPAPPNNTTLSSDTSTMAGQMFITMQSDIDTLFKTANVITDKQAGYSSTSSASDIVTFYKNEMKTRGWTLSKDGEVVDKETTVLTYESGKNGAMILVYDFTATDPGEGVVVITANGHRN